QVLNLSYGVNENKDMAKNSPVYVQVPNPDSEAHRLEQYGSYDESTGRANIDIVITEFFAPGNYGVPLVSMTDMALNVGTQHFSKSPNHLPLISTKISTSNPDTIPPKLDLNKIKVSARPTNSEAPNGETVVNIIYFAKDDKSGLGNVNYRLLDPQGVSHFEYHYHKNSNLLFFKGDPTKWQKYDIKVVLPPGSPPGIWGIQSMELSDKAHNKQSFNFVETMHFKVSSK
ncbi:hypothetical protein MJH12_09620, partial [bacterium]|nr:hypothetical protein [bacterium]